MACVPSLPWFPRLDKRKRNQNEPQAPGIGVAQWGHFPAFMRLSRTSCQERVMRVVLQFGQYVLAPSEKILPS